MTTSARLRRLGEQVVRGATLLGWYYRTRPEALRFLTAPAVAALLVMVLTVAWGPVAMTLMAAVVAGTFAVFAVPLLDEIRSLETVTADLDAGPLDLPWAAETTKERPKPESENPALRPEPPPGSVMLAATTTSVPPAPPVPDSTTYELHELAPSGRTILRTSTDFFDISDTAYELITAQDPAGLEIVRISSEEREPVWEYDRSESTAEQEQPQPKDIFGFDPSRRVGPSNRQPRNQ